MPRSESILASWARFTSTYFVFARVFRVLTEGYFFNLLISVGRVWTGSIFDTFNEISLSLPSVLFTSRKPSSFFGRLELLKGYWVEWRLESFGRVIDLPSSPLQCDLKAVVAPALAVLLLSSWLASKIFSMLWYAVAFFVLLLGMFGKAKSCLLLFVEPTYSSRGDYTYVLTCLLLISASYRDNKRVYWSCKSVD